ncbi:hypothetical protein Rhopal_006838-T1 [Rhodotorula paludigena]|uniref:MIOS-like alpha-solenoid domain-containing protein n=1 Tax=Rhodotorula paludigena TaxID=86838 RepID=A0AAV5GWC4_9BASI|nr:hypothetical protein Rhopal_006838-T1 [Rhodotorula paludigena]
MQSTRGKSILWDPTPHSNRFLVGGTAELRLYSHDPYASAGTAFHATDVVTELAGLRAFAWAPQSPSPLVAAGLTSGRVVLLRMDAADAAVQTERARAPAAVQINGLLAVGLEKGRGESLLVYDIQRSLDSSPSPPAPPFPSVNNRTYSLHRESSQTGRGRTHSPAGPASPSSSADPTPLVSFGSSEVVTSAVFLSAPSSPGTSATSPHSPLLVAGMANKWLRVYDLRTPPSTLSTWTTRSVYGVCANPHNALQFSSHAGDAAGAADCGVVRLWDLRKPMDPLLSFSDADAGAGPAARSRAPKALAETAWHPEKRGVFASLEKDAGAVRVWDLVDGPGPSGRGAGSPVEMRGGRARDEMDDQDLLRMPIVLDDRKTRPFQHSLTSFAFANVPTASPHDLHFIGLSRDSTSPGSSGQRLEMVSLPAAPHAAFLERGVLLTSSTASQATFSIPTGASIVNGGSNDNVALDLGDDPLSPTTPAAAQLSADPHSPPQDRGRALSLIGVLSPPAAVDRNATPRPTHPGMALRRISSTTGEILQLTSSSSALDAAGLRSLGTDMSVILRQRVEAGYGSDALVNASLCGAEGGIAEFWHWIARAQSLAHENSTADYDFRFRGVLRILLGFPSGMTNPALSAASSTSSKNSSPPASPRSTTPRAIHQDIMRSIRRGDEAQTKHAAYTAACATLVAKRRLGATFAISSGTQFAAQRKIALSACGAEWEEPWESVCERLAKEGKHELAARHAFFSGQMEKTMNFLRLCKDENLRMLAPIVAAYLAQKDTLRGGSEESNYAALCRSLSSDVETPWVRAMFAFLATSDWRELVDEMGLPLRDRVAVALRFLSDSELIPFLQELGDEALSSSDLEAVVLFGLRNDGLKLLGSYVDRTADVQTVALACSFTSPGLIRADMRVQRWVDVYRKQLDRMQLYAARAMFDAARGRRARAAFEQAKLAGRNAEAKEVAAAMRRTAPPQIVVRCQFCSTNISAAKSAGGFGDFGDGRSGAGSGGIK